MLTIIEGVYKNGQIRLLEQPVGIDEARVLVTLLPEAREAPRITQQIGDLLADKVKMDANIDADPVRDALDELKAERAMRFNS